MGIRIEVSGDAKVFRKEWDGGRSSFSVSLSKKNKDGKWESKFIPLRMRKSDAEKLHNKDEIVIESAFMSFDMKDDGKPGDLYIFLDKYTVKGGIPSGFQVMDDDTESIPF